MTELGTPSASHVAERKLHSGNVANLVKRISTELQSKSDVPVRPSATDVRQRRVKVVFSYTPQNDDELQLEVDDVVDVIGEEEEGWWKGRLKGRVGVFPSNFVKEIDGSIGKSGNANSGVSSRPESRNELEEKLKPVEETGETQAVVAGGEIQPKKVHGIGFGNIFAGDRIELRNTKPADSGKKAVDSPVSQAKDSKVSVTNGKKQLPAPSSDAIAGNASASKPKEFAKVLFAYEAQNDDELMLQEGDIITILAKEVEDAGWWMGELNGKQGVFPDNFVALITSEEADKEKKNVPTAPPPLVPAKPAKASSSPSEPAKMPETKTDSPKQTSNLKSLADSHSKDIDSEPVAPAAVPAEKPSIFKKPLIPLPGFSKPKIPPANHVVSSSSKPSTNDEKSDGLDSITMQETDRLQHPTTQRAKNPNKRPPSQAFLKEMAMEPSGGGSMTIANDANVQPKKPAAEAVDPGKIRPHVVGGEQVVRWEDFEKLLAAFEMFKRETSERIAELEKLVVAYAPKAQKM